jgi:hypothetical protein
VPEHRHFYRIRETTKSVLKEDDYILVFRCEYCPQLYLALRSNLWKR